MRIVSWNVNGIRAAEGKGLFEWMHEESPDILCLQETKAQEDQLKKRFFEQEGYTPYWNSADKKGYSGVAVYTRTKPESVDVLGDHEFDNEGRTLILDYGSFVLINAYFPNSQPEGRRLDHKLTFCGRVREYCAGLVEAGRSFVICGDFNIAHRPIDLARPKQNEQNPGYLPEEREWMENFLGDGHIDTFRHFCDEPGHYTWWSYRFAAREKNIGWRIDYFVVDKHLLDRVQSSEILSAVYGSDHCPIRLTLD
mgnify:CR=1 FL=1